MYRQDSWALLIDIQRIFGNRALFNSADSVRKQSANCWKNVEDDQALEAYHAATGNLENHFSQCSKKATVAVDDLLMKVPSTTYARRLKFMELLAGETVALGKAADLAACQPTFLALKSYFLVRYGRTKMEIRCHTTLLFLRRKFDWDEIRKRM